MLTEDANAIFFSDFLYKIRCYRYSFESPRHVEAIQMSTNNICFCKEHVDAIQIHTHNVYFLFKRKVDKSIQPRI